MIFRTVIVVLLFTLCLSSCSTNTQRVVWKDPNITLSSFTAFDILPVFDRTGLSVKKSDLTFLTKQLIKQFEVQNLQINAAKKIKKGVLVVESTILFYGFSKTLKPSSDYALATADVSVQPSSVISIQCKLLTRLIDKSTSFDVAEITTFNEITVTSVSSEDFERILKASAAAVSKEVAKMIRPSNP